MQRIMVTGGAGFIGSNFIHYMLQRYSDIHIVNIDKLTYAGDLNNLENITERYNFFKIDINETEIVTSILQEYNIDTIVHFAAESHVDRSIVSPHEFIQTNIVGTYSLLEAARKTFCRFHHISTDEVYGSLSPEDPAFTELTPYAPRSPYAASKASSDHLVYAYHHTYGLPITLSNCSNNYGPRQHAEKLIPKIIANCLASKPIPIYHQGSNIRDWLYVDDHCTAIDIILRAGKIGENYNIGASMECSNLALTHFVCEILAEETGDTLDDYLNLIVFVKDRPGHDFRYAINAQKIKEKLKWYPKHCLENGLRKTILWYLAKIGIPA